MENSKLRNAIGRLIIGFFCQSCVIYSFSGTSLSTKVKTFTIQNFQSKVALGPADLVQQLTEKLGSELIQKTPLKQVDTDGDLQFEGIITEFKYAPVAPSSSDQGVVARRTKLTITLQVSYSNAHDKEFDFNNKNFEQSADMDATASTDAEEPRLVEEVLTKLVKDVFNASVASW
ncbi:MAG: LPS assembly lipoprotein LptE [Bacteroidota bacterium]